MICVYPEPSGLKAHNCVGDSSGLEPAQWNAIFDAAMAELALTVIKKTKKQQTTTNS